MLDQKCEFRQCDILLCFIVRLRGGLQPPLVGQPREEGVEGGLGPGGGGAARGDGGHRGGGARVAVGPGSRYVHSW